jgi:broad specificity phosphatase PhoE
MSVEEIVRAVNNGCRVVLIIRHADKENLDPLEMGNGVELPISCEGKRKAFQIGKLLKIQNDEVVFYSSTRLRAIMTACEIARGMGISDSRNRIITDTKFSNSGFYYKNAMRVWKLFRNGTFYQKAVEYMINGSMDGFYPMKEAIRKFENYVGNLEHGTLTIIVSHFLIVSSLLYMKRVWNLHGCINPLDSAAIIMSPTGVTTFSYVPFIVKNCAASPERYRG